MNSAVSKKSAAQGKVDYDNEFIDEHPKFHILTTNRHTAADHMTLYTSFIGTHDV